jgi:hypothetical protein
MRWCIYLRYRGVERMEGVVRDLARGEEGIMSAERADGLGIEQIEKYSGLSRREIEGL